MIREGRINITDTLSKESGMLFTDENHELFLRLHCILEEIKNHELKLAIKYKLFIIYLIKLVLKILLFNFRWAENCKENFKNTNTQLEFALHKLQFVKLVKNKQLSECLSYATKYLSKFAVEHTSGLL